MKKIEKIVEECCICRDWKDNGKYYTPTPEQRRQHYNGTYNISHGLCNECYLLWEKKELSKLK